MENNNSEIKVQIDLVFSKEKVFLYNMLFLELVTYSDNSAAIQYSKKQHNVL